MFYAIARLRIAFPKSRKCRVAELPGALVGYAEYCYTYVSFVLRNLTIAALIFLRYGAACNSPPFGVPIAPQTP